VTSPRLSRPRGGGAWAEGGKRPAHLSREDSTAVRVVTLKLRTGTDPFLSMDRIFRQNSTAVRVVTLKLRTGTDPFPNGRYFPSVAGMRLK